MNRTIPVNILTPASVFFLQYAIFSYKKNLILKKNLIQYFPNTR